MSQPVHYDVIIIGGGPAGLTAGLYASRGRLKTLLLEKMGCGGQAAITDHIENYPGFSEGIGGFELAAKIEEQARKFALEIRTEEVQQISYDAGSNTSKVFTGDNTYATCALVIASGAQYKMLNVPGETEFRGRGVSYCATCDGPFFRGKRVAVIGGGDSALQEALYLSRLASRVTIVHRRDRLRATKILQERVHETPSIELALNSVVTAITGDDLVRGITVKDVVSSAERNIPLDGVFIFVGWKPNTEFLKDLVTLDDAGYIVTDETMATSRPGIFACGDARRKLLRQVVTAAGDGATAAFAAQEYLETHRGS
jgi:thioredoxin reductase (NADPH)